MDNPTPSPLTPLGARTPMAHPALYSVTAVLVIIVIAGAAWVFWPHAAVAPEGTPAPSTSSPVVGQGERCGGNTANAPQCATGSHCAPDPNSHLPFGDVGGYCVSDTNVVEYRNEQLGLSVKLPESWRGFSDVSPGMEWTAYAVGTGKAVDTGPMVVLQHPLWTQSKPYENLPIMVFTPAQWAHVGHEGPDEWSVSAAPIPPSVLASNSAYVFALPARYNYDYAQGFQELDDAIRAGAVSAFQP